MRGVIRWRTITALFTLATVAYAIRNRRSHGAFVGVPFEFRVPTVRRVRERWWNPADGRMLTPHVFGVGWSLNLHMVLKRLGLLKEHESTDDTGGSAGEEAN